MSEKIFDYVICLSSADEELDYKNVQNDSINVSHGLAPKINNT